MDAKPSQMLRQGKGTSMWNAIESVKSGKPVAAVSAGNTGALMALSMFILRKVEGVHRPALVGSWPTRKGVCAMLDLGADSPPMPPSSSNSPSWRRFARAVHGVQNPRVALLNIGEEELKGHEDDPRRRPPDAQKSGLPIDFRGFIEPEQVRPWPGRCRGDVHGFTGNVAIGDGRGHCPYDR